MTTTTRTILLLLLLLLSIPIPGLRAEEKLITAVDAVGITVSNMETAIDFYTKVLSIQKVSDVEVAGAEWESIQGLFGLRMRVVRLALGKEAIELTEYLAPEGSAIPPDSRSNDRWFQHIAIIVRDMESAYAHFRRFNVRHASSGPPRDSGATLPFSLVRSDGHPGKGTWFCAWTHRARP